MKSANKKLVAALVVTLTLLAASAFGQVYKFYKPGSIWVVSMIQVKPGMDPAYLQHLDGDYKKEMDAAVKAKLMKSYRVLRTLGDVENSWNMLLLQEYDSLASMEANEEKADNLSRQTLGQDDKKVMTGYEDRSKYRTLLGSRLARELNLK